jgi:hypothetical protein
MDIESLPIGISTISMTTAGYPRPGTSTMIGASQSWRLSTSMTRVSPAGERGYQFHRDHRCPGTHLVAWERFFACAHGRSDGAHGAFSRSSTVDAPAWGLCLHTGCQKPPVPSRELAAFGACGALDCPGAPPAGGQ